MEHPADITDVSSLIPIQYQVYALYAALALKFLGVAYSAIRNGGGLRRIIMAVWFGENLPKVVAQDYKRELSTPPFEPKPPEQPPAP